MSESLSTTQSGYTDAIHWTEEEGFLLGDLQYLTTPQWAEWIADRLHRRDPFPGPDPRQDEDPEFLYIELIPQLGLARRSAELAIEGLVTNALTEPWPAEPLCSLLYLVERLCIVDCAADIYAYLERHCETELEASTDTTGPYARALAALAALEGSSPLVPIGVWKKWSRKNRAANLPLCFSRLGVSNPDKAFSLLEIGDFVEAELAEALLDEIEVFVFTSKMKTDWWVLLMNFVSEHPVLLARCMNILLGVNQFGKTTILEPGVFSLTDIGLPDEVEVVGNVTSDTLMFNGTGSVRKQPNE